MMQSLAEVIKNLDYMNFLKIPVSLEFPLKNSTLKYFEKLLSKHLPRSTSKSIILKRKT